MQNFASVTDVSCTCGYLERSAEDPDHPIEFDDAVHEYLYLVRRDDGSIRNKLSIYHCPFCGGTAPPSKRQTLFAAVPDAEVTRIRSLFAGLESLDAVLAKHGPADLDSPDGYRSFVPERDGAPPVRFVGRSLLYQGLSDVADVHVHQDVSGEISWSIAGKYLGPKQET